MEDAKKPNAKLLWIITSVICIIAIVIGLVAIVRSDINKINDTPLSDELESAVDDVLLNSISDEEVAKYCYTVGEGHVVLGWNEYGGEATVYTWAGAQTYAFVNGKLTDFEGTGWAEPVVLTFTKNDDGTYTDGKITYPQDGTAYEESVRELFPKKLQEEALSDKSEEIMEQQDTQATDWLKANEYKKSKVVRSTDLKLTLLPDDDTLEEQNIIPYKDGRYPHYSGKRMMHINGKDVVFGSYYYKDTKTYIFFKYTYGAKTCKAAVYKMQSDGLAHGKGYKTVKVTEFFK